MSLINVPVLVPTGEREMKIITNMCHLGQASMFPTQAIMLGV